MKRIILASTSPRRKEILEKLGINFEVVPGGFEEDMSLPLAPKKLVRMFAEGKARAVAEQYPDAVVIGCDTVVVIEGKAMGKAKDMAHAKKMLAFQSGKNQTILSGIAVVHLKSKQVKLATVETKVVFKELSNKEITQYLATTVEWKDKAAAYAIQGVAGARFIEKIQGEPSNAIGLPAQKTLQFLKELKAI